MESRSEMHVAECGATVEVATVIHEGHEYSAMGSIIDEDRGLIVGYLSNDERSLTTWTGKHICALRAVSRFSAFGRPVVAYRATYNGKIYSGRCGGDSMLLRLRRKVSR